MMEETRKHAREVLLGILGGDGTKFRSDDDKFLLHAYLGVEEADKLLWHENSAAADLERDANELVGRINSVKRELRVHEVGEGGAEHCSIDNLAIGVDAIADWVGETMRELKQGLMK